VRAERPPVGSASRTSRSSIVGHGDSDGTGGLGHFDRCV
jgi:hypothetical protein